MKEQTFILENFKSFEPKHIFECGQCFRWNEEDDGSYTGVFKGNVINVKKINKDVIFKGLVSGDIKEIVTDYFDLNRDYEKIKKTLLTHISTILSTKSSISDILNINTPLTT